MMLTRSFATLALTGLAILSAKAQKLDGVWRSEGYGSVAASVGLRATTRLDGHSNADMDYDQAPTARISCQELTGIPTASRKKEGIHVH